MEDDHRLADERAIEALLIALATQVGSTHEGAVSSTVLSELAASHRSVVRAILGSLGNLIHYGAGDELERLAALRDQLTSALRDINGPAPEGASPGDAVELLVDRPEDGLVAGTRLTVRYVGDDGTTDVEPPDDYVLATVPSVEVRRL